MQLEGMPNPSMNLFASLFVKDHTIWSVLNSDTQQKKFGKFI
ncbi:TPA: hypothetical protein ACGOVA_002076 [Streptococcus suis]